MKTTYVKFIFEKGSIIFRKIKSYNYDKNSAVTIIVFEDNTSCWFDMIFMFSHMGKMIKVIDNL